MPIEQPDDAWAACCKEYRISDTRECRQAFMRGAFYAAQVAGQAVAKNNPEMLTVLLQALRKFGRERC